MNKERTMRISWQVTAPAVLSAALAFGQAGEAERFLLKFDKPMSRLSRSIELNPGSWKYYVTVPGEERDDVRSAKEVARFINPIPDNDASACRLLSRNNYVGMFRQVPPGYENLRRISWKWSVKKHPHGGKIGGPPNDQSMQIYVLYREGATDKEVYTALSFVWTDKTTATQQSIQGRMPWDGSPLAEVIFIARRNGPIPGELSEDVDLRAEYRRVFRREAPPAWAIILLADSNEVEPDVGQMTTDAVIREIRLAK
jgi:hypothetical protein